MSQETYLNFQEVCSLLKIKSNHLRSLLFKRAIPHIKVGRLIRFERTRIEEWLKKNAVGESNE